MRNVGIKVAKVYQKITSLDLRNYIFWTKYKPLTFIEKVTFPINITSSSCVGQFVYDHNYGFIPLVIGFVTPQGSTKKVLMPYSGSLEGGLNCGKGGGALPAESINYKIKKNTIVIDYSAQCIVPQVGSSCPLTDVTYTITLYFYMHRLGS